MAMTEEEKQVARKVVDDIDQDPRHKAYRKARNSLIPLAVEYANKIHGKGPVRGRGKTHHADVERQEWNDAWTATYLQRMHVLAVQAGIESCGECDKQMCLAA